MCYNRSRCQQEKEYPRHVTCTQSTVLLISNSLLFAIVFILVAVIPSFTNAFNLYEKHQPRQIASQHTAAGCGEHV